MSGGISVAGASGSGATSGHGASGNAGNGAGDSGAAGASGAAACDGDCSGSTPVCDATSNKCVQCLKGTDCKAPKPACETTSNTCVECTKSGDCKAAKPVCDLTSNACVECAAKTDCKDAAKPFCDNTASQCVACLKQADCTDATASACNSGSCKPCTADAECSNIAGKGVCDAGTCVQCTGKKFAACGMDTGTPLVCDSLKRTCTTSKQNSSGLCQACVTDAQCDAGKICVLDQFGTPAKDVGYFCHWKKGDVANGAPADCFATGKPYSVTRTNAVSVDGATSDICTLAASTCTARNQFKNKDCAVGSAPSDALCGFSPGVDSKCTQVPSSTSYRCTMTCFGNDDCPGTSCNTGVNPAVCLLQ